MIDLGTNNILQESDVYDLSPTMQARPVYVKFCSVKSVTLLRRLLAANSLDLIIEFTLTFVSVVFNYLGPFFLKRILDLLEKHEGESEQSRKERISLAYTYAFLAFLSTLAKAEVDVQHLWYGRRATTRIRTSLMTAVYDKALKRKDFSGIVDNNSKADSAPTTKVELFNCIFVANI
jgi:ABC-type multidrug transport system fused ATPase/permease subunit